MRVLCLNPYLPAPLGGIEKEMLAVAAELVAMGHTVDMLATTARFPDGENEHAEGIPDGIDAVRLRGHLRSTLRGFAPARSPLIVPGLADRAAALEPELVLVFNVGWGPVVRPVVRRLRAMRRSPTILYRTYFHPPGGVLTPYKAAYILRTVARADRAFVATEVERRELIATGHLLPERIAVIPPGVHVHVEDPALVAALAAQHRLEGRDVIAHVGRLSAFKGTLDLIETLPLVRASTGRDVVLLLIGANQEPAAIDTAIARADVAEHVRFAGEIHDDRVLRALLRSARVMALPSQYEAYGIVYIEAQAEGLVCVGCEVGGVAEAIGDAGVRIGRFGDRPALVDALTRLVSDDAHRRALGAGGRERVLGTLTWAHTAGRILELAEQCRRARTDDRRR